MIQNNPALKAKIDQLWDKFWAGGIANPLTAIERICMGFPPFSLLNQFDSIAEKAESIKTLFRKSMNELENLYSALSQKAFKGKLDLSRIPLDKVTKDSTRNCTADVSPY